MRCEDTRRRDTMDTEYRWEAYEWVYAQTLALTRARIEMRGTLDGRALKAALQRLDAAQAEVDELFREMVR